MHYQWAAATIYRGSGLQGGQSARHHRGTQYIRSTWPLVPQERTGRLQLPLRKIIEPRLGPCDGA